MSTRVANLYRRIARVARALPTKRERMDALGEAREGFRAETSTSLEERLAEGERRLALAEHYGIAYSRLEHAQLSGGGEKYVEPPSVGSQEAEWASAALAATMRSQFPVNPAGAAARAKARARRAAVARSENAPGTGEA